MLLLLESLLRELGEADWRKTGLLLVLFVIHRLLLLLSIDEVGVARRDNVEEL